MPIKIPYEYDIDYNLQFSENEVLAIAAKVFNRNLTPNIKYLGSHDKNVLSLEDKIAKIVEIDSEIVDELAWMDGEKIQYGHAIEETYINYIKSRPYTGEQTSKSYIVTSKPACYSFFGPRRIMSVTILSEMVDSGVRNAQQAAEFVMKFLQRLYDSKKLEKIAYKKELLGKRCALVDEAYENAEVFDPTKNYNDRKALNDSVETLVYVKKDSSSKEIGVIAKPYTANTKNSWDEAVEVNDADTEHSGYIIPIKILTATKAPGTGETEIDQQKNSKKFILSLKDLKAKISHNKQNRNLAGALIGGGAVKNLLLILRESVQPRIDLDILLGAQNPAYAATNFNIMTVSDFGSYDKTEKGKKTLGLLIDTRSIRLHPKYEAMRRDDYGEADKSTYHLHYRFWPFQSLYTNTVKIEADVPLPDEYFDN